MCFNLPGAPRGLGKTGGLIPGINGELPGNCVLPGIGITGVHTLNTFTFIYLFNFLKN